MMLNCSAKSIVFIVLLGLPCGRGTNFGDESGLRVGEAFVRRLESTASLTWKGNPLREGLGNLERTHQIAIFLDRRVDPGLEMDFAVSNATLDELFKRLAASIHLANMPVGSCTVSSVVYLGPATVAGNLATVAAIRREETQKLPAAARARLTKPTVWAWEELATPRELLTQAAQESGIQIYNLDVIPHDLWPAVHLPPLEFADRMSIVLAGFGKTFRYSPMGDMIQIIPLPEKALLKKTYSVRGNVASVVQQLTDQFANCRIGIAGERVEVEGSVEDHDAIARLLRGEKVTRRVAGPAETRYTLRMKNSPVGGVIKGLSEKLTYQVTVEPDAQPLLSKLVTFEVTNATVEELFRAALEPAGLDFKLAGQQLTVTRRKE